LKTKLILTKKTDESGKETRKKARLVVVGSMARPGEDYEETYAPVSKMATIRIFLALVVQYSLEMQQIEVDTAFQYASLEESIYVEVPQLYRDPTGVHPATKALKLNRALYGLPQAPRRWFITLGRVLKQLGYQPLVSEPCFYTATIRGAKALLIVYVDDMLLAHSDKRELDIIISKLESHFKIKRLGSPRKLLGLSIFHDMGKHVIEIDCRFKIQKLVNQLNLEYNVTTTLPMEPTTKFRASGIQKPSLCKYPEDLYDSDKSTYRSIVGSVMYIALGARPDVLVSICMLSKYMKDPKRSHLRGLREL